MGFFSVDLCMEYSTGISVLHFECRPKPTLEDQSISMQISGQARSLSLS